MRAVALYYEGHHARPIKTVHGVEALAMLEHLTKRDGDKGMIVNDKKTTLLCIYAASLFEKENLATLLIVAQKTMKTLGYHVDNNCDQARKPRQVAICSRLWARTSTV